MTTRRQHYVWRHYLTRWATGNSIRVLPKSGAPYAANPLNAAVSRDFYRLPILTEEDEAFVGLYLEKAPSPEPIRQLNREWFAGYALPSRIRRTFGATIERHPEAIAALKQAEIELEELAG
jgi:hypothetical protein